MALADDPQLTTNQNNALGVLNKWLGQFQLGDLGDTVKQWIIQGYSPERVQLEITDTPVFKTQFPEYQARIDKGLPPMSPADILNYRSTATQIMKDAGLPAGFYDNKDDFVNLVTSDISPTELQGRVQAGYAKVANAPQEVKDAFNQYFGVQGEGNLAAFFLDPSKATPVIQKAVSEAQIGGAGQRFGFQVSADQASRYAELGISNDQASQGFSQAAQMRPLGQGTISESSDLTDEQLANAALGVNATDQAAVQRRQEERKAGFRQAYGGAGGGAQGQQGIGVGGAPST